VKARSTDISNMKPTPGIIRVKLLGALLCALLAIVGASQAADASKPNILFILIDDEGWPTLGCYGNTFVPTPHIDSLSRDGVRFTDAYVMPQCTPTRASLLSGQHTARNGMWHVIPWYALPWARVAEPAYREQFPRDAFNLPKGLRAAGYATGMAGKWHLTSGADGDYVALKPEAADAYGFDFVAPKGPGSQNEGDKWVDHLTDEAIGFIEKQRGRPWFFYLAHHTIHAKVSAPPALVEKYLAKGAPAVGMHNATYLAAIEHLDNSVGRLLAKLDALKLRESTMVVFLSDNGGVKHVYDLPGEAESDAPLKVRELEFDNTPLRSGKGSPYEGGLRVPCLVRWPGAVKAGTVSDTPIHITDWLPTLLDVAGGKAPEGYAVDGTNLVSLLKGGQLPPRPLYWYVPLYDLRWAATPCAVVRDGDWKLVEYFGDWFDDAAKYHAGNRVELYNLRADLGETHDLAGIERDRAAQLRDQLRAWMKSLPVPIPGANPHFDAQKAFSETKTKQPWNH
jgi:uncharacterized sulfatase